jgi:hypothetical protein
MTEELENNENHSEAVQRKPFTEEEKEQIRYWSSKIYSRKDEAGVFLDVQDARQRLELMGCDLSRADALSMADLSEGQYADQIIMKGKATEVKDTALEIDKEEQVSEKEVKGELIVTKSLKEGTTLEIGTAKAILIVKPNPNSDSVLEVEIIANNAIIGKQDLIAGKNTIGRQGENDIVITVPEVSRNHAVIEVSQEGYSVKDLNSLNGTREI